ncbi:hypothetical protein [Verrucomicrobium spinosum]|uniref:hypothetical protein n=1 Tax=Verrucomicrobium spinosum TaxID=2736 RepID=UPI001C46FA86|nr:hypothetical protein [Verrucomicrobium spinosum]
MAAHHWRDSRHEEEIRHIFEVKVDLTKREGEVENQIKKSVKMLSTARWHLLGLESLRGSNKRERLAAKERGEVNQISPDWLVVEAMDGQKHADLTLNGSLRTNRLRLLKWYTDACDELGVDPKGGVGFGEAYSIWPEDLELEGGPG